MGLAGLLALAGGAAGAQTQCPMLWQVQYESPSHATAWCESVAYDAWGNLLAAGWEDRKDLGQFDDIRVVKYDPLGNVVWTRTLDMTYVSGGVTVHGDDHAFGVATDAAGNAYVCGQAYDTFALGDAWLAKFGPDGTELWSRTYDSPAHDQDVYWAVAVTPDGGTVYAAGSERRPDLGQEGNLLVQSYDGGTGAPLGPSFTFNDPAFDLYEEAWGVAVAPDGSVYVTGYETRKDGDALHPVDTDTVTRRLDLWFSPSTYGIGGIDAALLLFRLTPALAETWSARMGSSYPNPAPPGSQPAYVEWGRGVAVLPDGTPVVAGSVQDGTAGTAGFDRIAAAWRTDGSAPAWTRLLAQSSGEADNDDFGTGAAWGGDGRVHVVGSSERDDLFQGLNLTEDELDPATGAPLFPDAVYPPGYLTDERGLGVAAGPGGVFAVCGSYTLRQGKANQHGGWLVAAFASAPSVAPPVASTAAVWPNPFNPATAVGGTVKFGGLGPGATVRLYTAGGRLVRTLAGQGGAAAWDGLNDRGVRCGTGVYPYVITGPDGTVSQGRILLVRE